MPKPFLLRRNLTTPSQFSGRRFIVIRCFSKVFVEANQAPQRRKPLPGHGAGAHRHRFGGSIVLWSNGEWGPRPYINLILLFISDFFTRFHSGNSSNIKFFCLNRASTANGFFLLLLAWLGVGNSFFIGTECRDTMMPCLLPVVNHPPGQHHSTGRQATVAILKRNGGEVWSNNQTSRPSDFRIPSHYFIWEGEEIGRNSLLLRYLIVEYVWLMWKHLLAKAITSCVRNAFTCLRGSSCLSWTQGGSQLHAGAKIAYFCHTYQQTNFPSK